MAGPAVARAEPLGMGGNRQDERGSGSQHARGLLQGPAIVLDVLDHLAGDDGVEGVVRERKLGHVRRDDVAMNTGSKHLECGRSYIGADDLEGTLLEPPRERP